MSDEDIKNKQWELLDHINQRMLGLHKMIRTRTDDGDSTHTYEVHDRRERYLAMKAASGQELTAEEKEEARMLAALFEHEAEMYRQAQIIMDQTEIQPDRAAQIKITDADWPPVLDVSKL